MELGALGVPTHERICKQDKFGSFPHEARGCTLLGVAQKELSRKKCSPRMKDNRQSCSEYDLDFSSKHLFLGRLLLSLSSMYAYILSSYIYISANTDDFPLFHPQTLRSIPANGFTPGL